MPVLKSSSTKIVTQNDLIASLVTMTKLIPCFYYKMFDDDQNSDDNNHNSKKKKKKKKKNCNKSRQGQ